MTGPTRVQPARHSAADVGDEPLLLAQVRPTWIARSRPAGIGAAVAAGAQLIVMDDGFQNPSVEKDVALIVVDGLHGFGNRLVMPAGPLREPLAAGLGRAQAVVLIGPDRTGAEAEIGDLPVLRARLAPCRDAVHRLQGRKVVAFAGIGHPAKFFNTLREMNCRIHAFRAFPDHHAYRKQEIADLLSVAQRAGAIAVTTAKDVVRLPASTRGCITVLPVSVCWEDDSAVERVLRPLFFHE